MPDDSTLSYATPTPPEPKPPLPPPNIRWSIRCGVVAVVLLAIAAICAKRVERISIDHEFYKMILVIIPTWASYILAGQGAICAIYGVIRYPRFYRLALLGFFICAIVPLMAFLLDWF